MPRPRPRRLSFVMLCGCPRDLLCERCRDALFEQLRGTAACRGEAWADSIAARLGGAHQWPAYGRRVAELARGLVIDLARDATLRELLAIELAKWAALRWRQHATSDCA